MAKKVAVLAVNPVNGFGLFQYLESFFENGITYKVYAVADSKEIKTNSGIALTVDDVIANLKGHEDEYDAMVFACGDAVPVFQQNASKQYNIDLMDVIKNFGEKGKIMIGHCAAAMLFDFTGTLYLYYDASSIGGLEEISSRTNKANYLNKTKCKGGTIRINPPLQISN